MNQQAIILNQALNFSGTVCRGKGGKLYAEYPDYINFMEAYRELGLIDSALQYLPGDGVSPNKLGWPDIKILQWRMQLLYENRDYQQSISEGIKILYGGYQLDSASQDFAHQYIALSYLELEDFEKYCEYSGLFIKRFRSLEICDSLQNIRINAIQN